VEVVATDFAFPSLSVRTAPAGPVTFRVTNRGKELHMMAVIWLGSHTTADFVNALQHQTGIDGTFEVGGPNGIAPGETVETTVVLPAGHIILACWIDGEQEPVHVAKGMFTDFDVTPAAGAPAPEPAADDTITLSDYAIRVAGPLTAGHHRFRVQNAGPSSHDVVLFRMAEGATMEDVRAWIRHPGSGSPRATPVGGSVGFDPARHSYLEADLVRGRYVLVCIIPGDDGKPHFEGHGMMTEVTVR
jgi:uncharacterized cupredoxin-like copper-binding protein